MANQRHINLLKKDITAWNKWRKAHPEIQPDLWGADFREIDLTGANLARADLRFTNFHKANLSEANLSLANTNLKMFSSQSNEAGKTEAILANFSEAKLTKANLRGATLVKSIFYKANLHEADLGPAILNQANPSLAHLTKIDIGKGQVLYLNSPDEKSLRFWTQLSEADFSEADLSGADLTLANLAGADLSGADLNGTNLSHVTLAQTILAGVDLSSTKGLVQIRHHGPSIIQLHSIKLPQDGSALHFLRRVGIPDEWIDLYRAQMMVPIQYHSCFISYSSQDNMLAHRLHADLQDQGVRCWFAPEDMKIGSKIRSRIDEAIHQQDKFLLLLSEHAIASAWVEDEVEAALEKEQRQQREVLFPIRLDESVMQTSQAWAAKLRRRHIGDFTHWTDPQSYQKAFERLLRDLKASVEIQEKASRDIDF